MTKTDAVFLKHFSQIIAFLVVITVCILVYSAIVHYRFYDDPKSGLGMVRAEANQAASSARISPVSGVFAGANGLAAQAAVEKAAAAAAALLVAYDGTLDGAVIYEKLCTSCHTSGAGGSPMMLQSVWAPRIAQGEATLVKHAIEGYKGEAGIMPARGGNPSLNDAQVEATVKWMLTQLK